jgi:nuclear pore complex protein Nup98-Nup96
MCHFECHGILIINCFFLNFSNNKYFVHILNFQIPIKPPSRQHGFTGVVLTRIGYYTIPTLAKLSEYLDDDGHCVVPNFTVGREGFGKVFFNEPIDVSGLNLDVIVQIEYRKVTLYPGNEQPEGQGLNRKALVTFDRVWPTAKSTGEPVKDPAILKRLNFVDKLRDLCKNSTGKSFVGYEHSTGSLTFEVTHFSQHTIDIPNQPEPR